MPKRLVIFADGTWNSETHSSDYRSFWPAKNAHICEKKAHAPQDKPLALCTNVSKLHHMLLPRDAAGTRQLHYYHPGVGTGGGLDAVLGGIGGYGLARNILACYRFLVHNYEEGDQIFLFGFSRGAYTVRSLAGMIRNCGLLRAYHRHQIANAYELYRDRSDDTHPSSTRARMFRRRYAQNVEITCIGVWDTVGSLGIPEGVPGHTFNPLLRRQLEFHDVKLSSWVKHAFQALAIDEQRRSFQATLWEGQNIPGQQLEQVWFAGVHCDVGGGYADSCLSDIPLRWMAKHAMDCGLALDDQQLPAPVTAPAGTLHDSMTLAYRPFGAVRRSIPCAPSPHLPPSAPALKGVIHRSAIERLNDPQIGYYPTNLVEYLDAHSPVPHDRSALR